ncbi:hypothetical protein UB38_04085 [Photobacterium iliopiscarium]|nr:hypothetical protein UB38_04085 [Photobacterium iliopiscarium]
MNNKKPLGNCNEQAVQGAFLSRYIMDKPRIRNSDAVRDIRLISPSEEGIIISVCGIDAPFVLRQFKA